MHKQMCIFLHMLGWGVTNVCMERTSKSIIHTHDITIYNNQIIISAVTAKLNALISFVWLHINGASTSENENENIS